MTTTVALSVGAWKLARLDEAAHHRLGGVAFAPQHLLQVGVVDVIGQSIGADDEPIAGLQDAVIHARFDIGLAADGLLQFVAAPMRLGFFRG